MVDLRSGLPEIRCSLPGCRNRFRRSKKGDRNYCTLAHAWLGRAMLNGQPLPSSAFARFLFQQWQESELSRAQFARLHTMSPATLSLYLRELRRPDAAMFANLTARYGDALPLPGSGRFSDQAQAARAKGIAAMRRLSGSNRRLTPLRKAIRTVEYRERLSAKMTEVATSRLAAGKQVADESPEQRRARALSVTNRIQRAVGKLLRGWAHAHGLEYHRNGHLDQHPTRDEIRAMVGAVASTYGVSHAEVLDAAKPGLIRRGIWAKTGRKSADYWPIVDRLEAEYKAKHRRRAPRWWIADQLRKKGISVTADSLRGNRARARRSLLSVETQSK